MDHHLYAIVDGLPRVWRAPVGVAGAPVAARRCGELIVVTAVMDATPSPDARAIAAHHNVVASTINAAAVLPFHYGAVIPDGDVHEWVALRRRTIDEALAHVRGCVEMVVKLVRLDGSPRRGEPDVDLRALGDRLVAHAGVADWRYRPTGNSGHVAASVAFLVPRLEVPAFLARIAPVASRAVGVAVVPTGPWPAYSFVPSLDRLPLARLDAAPLSTGRRAG